MSLRAVASSTTDSIILVSWINISKAWALKLILVASAKSSDYFVLRSKVQVADLLSKPFILFSITIVDRVKNFLRLYTSSVVEFVRINFLFVLGFYSFVFNYAKNITYRTINWQMDFHLKLRFQKLDAYWANA